MGHPEDAGIRFLTGVYELYEPRGSFVELDLGCGSGSYTAARAKQYPEHTILAADVMIGRLRKVVKRRERDNLANLEVLRIEARMLVGLFLPDHSLDVVHLLCPDPWPKGRHRGHRLLCCDFTTQLHRILKLGGVFHFSSDDEAYCAAVNRILNGSGLFAPAPELLPELTMVQSDFERRWLAEGKAVHHMAWRTGELPCITIGH